jgi:anti-sigma factor RsiW
MRTDNHERARRLIDALHVEGITDSERRWLEAHQAECPACQARAQATEKAIQSLRSNTVLIDPAVVGITQARVRLRARELQANHMHLRALWISCGLSWLVGAVTAPLLWEAIAWVGRQFDASQAVRIMAFVIFWIAPATVVGAFMAWRHAPVAGMRGDHEPWER